MILIACSNDDDQTVEPFDMNPQTLGTWSLRDRIPHGLEFCELQTTIEFKEEQDLHVVVYNGDEPGDCDFFESGGTWEYIDGNKMRIQFDSQAPIYLWATFENNINTMHLTYDESEITETFVKVSND